MYKMYKKLIKESLLRLRHAAEEIEQQTMPTTPMPRARIFHICKDISWPSIKIKTNAVADWNYIAFKENRSLSLEYYPREATDRIIKKCHYQPRKILRALRRIEAATAWCYARAEGRKRAAEEILRQQASALEILEAEAALLALE